MCEYCTHIGDIRDTHARATYTHAYTGLAVAGVAHRGNALVRREPTVSPSYETRLPVIITQGIVTHIASCMWRSHARSSPRTIAPRTAGSVR